MIAKTTTNQNYPKPDENNSLLADVRNIENALDMIDQEIANIGIPPHSTILSAGGVNSGSATLSSSNNWSDFPDLSIEFTVPLATTVMVFYHITMPGSDNYLCTRVMVDAAEVTRGISGNIHYWCVSQSCAVDLEVGQHTIKIQYRTPAGGVNNPAGLDWQTRLLQVMVMGKVTII
jgi:hypothetical protein